MQLNSTKPFAGIFAIAALAYAVYAVVPSDPLTKMNRMCTPFFIWPEKVIVAGARIFAPSYVPKVESAFDGGFSNCRLWIWNAVYEPEYRKMEQGQSDGSTAGSQPAAGQRSR